MRDDEFNLGLRWGTFASDLDSMGQGPRDAVIRAIVKAVPGWPETIRYTVANCVTDAYSAYLSHGFDGDD